MIIFTVMNIVPKKYTQKTPNKTPWFVISYIFTQIFCNVKLK